MITKRRIKKTIMLVALLGAAFYLFWPGVALEHSGNPNLHLGHTASFGNDQRKGNVVGIEPYMEAADYSSATRFKTKLSGYFQIAKEKGWFGKHTIVLLPEHLGTWLLATGYKSRVYEASSTSGAMLPIISSNLAVFLKNLFIFDDPDIGAASVIRMQTVQVAELTRIIYSELAQHYGVTIVAGSQALMTPGIYPDSLSYGHGPIFNSSFVFDPNGKAQVDAVRKVHPIPSEIGFTQASSADFLPTFDVGDRKLGVLICADSWFDDTSESLASQGTDLLLVPSFLEGIRWSQPWQGYLNDSPLSKAWKQDVNHITEGEAWLKYALPARAKKHGIFWGMNVFLKGEFWGMKGYGHAIILENGKTHLGKASENEAAIYNLWLG